jgi:glycosyltransferase involved in cell wall biosynthesis
MDISIIVPLFNEEDSVEPLFKGIADVLTSLDCEAEVIFVDDGSSDQTFDVARGIATHDRRLKVIKFRRNFGQTPAMAAGIDYAKGSVIIAMDGDLQNDPRDIPEFLAELDKGFDIVVGWRHNRQDKLVTRKIPSRIANWLIGKVTGVPIKDNGCSLKAFRSSVIKGVPLYNEMHRFIPAMASITGAKISEIKVRHHARQFGESKYGLSRIYKVLFDLLVIKTIASFAARPMVWFGLLALPFFLLANFLLGYAVFDFAADGSGSISIGGAGLFFATLVAFLIFGGGLGELIIRSKYDSIESYPLMTATEASLAKLDQLVSGKDAGISE